MKTDIRIRVALVSDVDAITNLFKETIITVNAKDYGPEQTRVWSAGADKKANWIKKIEEQYFLIAEAEGIMAGFGSITKTRYLDFMYVHKNFQRMGVAEKLLHALEEYAKQTGIKIIASDVSITAKPFFEKKCYMVITKQKKILEGIEFANYKMEKKI
jgi:putative acetyltransferase